MVGFANATSVFVPGRSSLTESGTIHPGWGGLPLPCNTTDPLSIDVGGATVAVLDGVGVGGEAVQVTVDGPEATFTVPTVAEAVTVSVPAVVPA